MPRFLMLKRSLRPALVPAIGASLVGYFAYHTVQGEHGIIARHHLRIEIEEAQATLSGLAAERVHLEHRADLLNPRHLDTDMLDERLRTMLNYGHPDEVVIYLPKDDAAAE